MRAGRVTFPCESLAGLIFCTAGISSIGPVRNFGPPRSIRMRQGLPVTRVASRRRLIIPDHAAGSSWEQLMRTQSIPLLSNCRTSRKSSAVSAGRVTMICARRFPGCSPSRAMVFCSRWAAPSRKALFTAGRQAAGCSFPLSTPRLCSTASRVASTCGSARPIEDRPK